MISTAVHTYAPTAPDRAIVIVEVFPLPWVRPDEVPPHWMVS